MGKVKSYLLATAFSLTVLSACGNSDDAASDDTENSETGETGFSFYADDAAIGRESLRQIVDPFFDNDELSETRALVIMHGGIVIAERYAPGYGPNSKMISWSMAKTVTGTLIGIMVGDGRLALDEAAPVKEWQISGDDRSKITLRHLMHMSSGLDHDEMPSEENGKEIYEVDTTRMLFLPDGREDVARYAETRVLEAPPGQKYEYSTATSHILVDIMTRTLTDSKNADVRKNAMLQFAKGRLFEPLGMDSMTPEFDRSGTMLGGSMIHATARDWAKLGEFLRNKGSVKGAQLLPRSWVNFMRTSAKTDAAYGGHVWLNKKRPEGRNQILFPDRAPDDVFAMLGHLGQFVVVSPQNKLVIVRLGKTENANMAPVNDQLARVVSAFPKRKD